MSLDLYAHPFSSYCQKALIALYENDVPFDLVLLEPGGGAWAELSGLWPLGKFPVLVDAGKVVREASIIIEHLAVHHPGPVGLIPADPDAAFEARFLDRFFDNYVLTPQGAIVGNALRPEGARDPYGVEQSRALLDKSYQWLDALMTDRTWAIGEAFSLADCAAAPALLYADWTHPIPRSLVNLTAYRTRLIERPSYARALDGARPYRPLFPLGAPADRD
jgi:glutathione S-transferase